MYERLQQLSEPKMTLFEVMTALSASLAIAIPTFMEKVMRPKYEERFSDFRRARREVFFDEFENAFNQVKKAKGEMTPDIMETIESLFNEWGQVKADENKLTTLLRYRKFFFIGWLVCCALCLFAIQYSESPIWLLALTIIDGSQEAAPIPFGSLVGFFFSIMFIWTLWYGFQLFRLDETLTKFMTKTTGETFVEVESIRTAMESYREAERKVENALKKFNIPFHKDTIIEIEGLGTEVDFAIPTRKKPRYLIEVKTRLFRSAIYNISLRYDRIKSQIPAKTILISDFTNVSADFVAFAQAYFDFVVDFQELEKLEEIIKL